MFLRILSFLDLLFQILPNVQPLSSVDVPPSLDIDDHGDGANDGRDEDDGSLC